MFHTTHNQSPAPSRTGSLTPRPLESVSHGSVVTENGRSLGGDFEMPLVHNPERLYEVCITVYYINNVIET